MCVRRGRASFVKDGSIFKRARAAAACSGAAQAGGGGRRNGESAQFLPQERRGGGRRPHFHPPAIFGGAFFYLAGLLASILLLPLFALLALPFHGSVFVPSFLFYRRSLKKESYSSILFPRRPSEGVGWVGRVNYDKGWRGSYLPWAGTCILFDKDRDKYEYEDKDNHIQCKL